MSVGGGQDTEKTKIDIEVNGKADQGFLNIAETLKNLGAWTDNFSKSIDNLNTRLEKMEKTVGRIQGKGQVNINSTTDTLSVKEKGKQSNQTNSKTTFSGLNSVENAREIQKLADSTVKQINASKELTKALTEKTKKETSHYEDELEIRKIKTKIAELESPSRTASREVYTAMMSDPTMFAKRQAKNLADTEWINQGGYAESLNANLAKTLANTENIKARTERTNQLIKNNEFSSNQRYNQFTSGNMFSKYAKLFTERTANRNDFVGYATKLGGILNPTEIFSKKNSIGASILGTGIAGGGFSIAAFLTAAQKATQSLIQFGDAALQAHGTISKLETSLEVVYGSKAESGAVFDEIAEYATRSPFGVQQVTEMAILLKQSGIYESDLLDTLETIGDLAGGNEEKYRRIANNYAQVLAIGKATTKDMREFANAGIPIFEATADYLGVSRKELSNEIEQGKVTGQVIEEVFKRLTGEGGIFYQATAKGAETYNARNVNIQDFKQLALASWGESFYTGARLGNYGEGSLVKTFLDMKEEFWQFIKDWGDKGTTKASVNYVRNIENYTQSLKDTLESLNQQAENGIAVDPVLAKEIAKEIKNAEEKVSDDEKIAILNKGFDAQLEKINKQTDARKLEEIEADFNEANKKYTNLLNRIDALLFIGDTGTAMSLNPQASEAGLDLEVLKVELASAKKREQRIEELYSDKDLVYGKIMTTLMSLSNEGKDSVTKSFKNNPNSLENLGSSISDLYKNTDEYARTVEKQNEEIVSRYEGLVKEMDKLGLDSSLSFIQKTGMSYNNITDFLGKYYTGNGLFSDGNIDNKDITTILSNIGYIEKAGDLTIEQTGVLKYLKDVFSSYGDKSILSVDDVYELKDIVKNGLSSSFADLFSMVFTEYEVGSADDKYKAVKADLEKKRKEKTQSLWARIIGGSIGYDPENLEWTGFRANDINNWLYGINTYTSGVYNHPNYTNEKPLLSFRGSMQQKNGVAALLQAGGSDYYKSLEYARKINGDYVTGSFTNNVSVVQYDWEKSFENLKKAALSLESSSAMTASLADYYKLEQDRFETILTTGLVQEEDFEKLSNSEYKATFGYLGEEFEQLQNVLGAELIDVKDENGKVIGKELSTKGLEIIKTMADLAKQAAETASQFNDLKLSTENLIKSTEELDFSSTAIRSQLFGSGLSENEQDSLISTVYSSIANQLTAKGVTDEKTRESYFAQTEGYINAAVTGDRSAYTEGSVEMALVDAMLALIDATKENTNVRIGLDVTKVTAGTTDYGIKEVGSFLGNKNNYSFASFLTGGDLFGKDIKGNYITSSLGASDVSYDRFKEAMLSEENADILKDWEKITGLSVETDGFDKVAEAMANAANASNQMEESLATIANGSLQAFKDFAKSGFVSTFEEWGKAVKTGEKASENIAQAWEDLGASLAGQISTLLITEGLKIAGSSALVQNWGMTAVGLGMVAAGGAASWLSGYLGADEEEDKKAEDEVERLQTLKDMLADLLAQARIDAEYYEKNLRHQYAISANENISSYSVNDAVITPKGDIISTHPDDWLIATKTPQDLSRGGGAAPIVTITIVNESGSQVAVTRTEQTQRGNEIDVKAIIVAATNEALAMGGLDSGMQAYQQRQQGRVFTR